jgi:hypothetical protein
MEVRVIGILFKAEIAAVAALLAGAGSAFKYALTNLSFRDGSAAGDQHHFERASGRAPPSDSPPSGRSHSTARLTR